MEVSKAQQGCILLIQKTNIVNYYYIFQNVFNLNTF